MTHFLARSLFALGLVLTAALPARAELVLYMIEQRGCAYCKLWDREVSQAYANSEEGARAPLQRLDLRASVPPGVSFVSRPVFTPTFILVRDGQEVGRIEGYMSAHFFWEHLGQMLKDASDP
jgi:hypothetical protein